MPKPPKPPGPKEKLGKEVMSEGWPKPCRVDICASEGGCDAGRAPTLPARTATAQCSTCQAQLQWTVKRAHDNPPPLPSPRQRAVQHQRWREQLGEVLQVVCGGPAPATHPSVKARNARRGRRVHEGSTASRRRRHGCGHGRRAGSGCAGARACGPWPGATTIRGPRLAGRPATPTATATTTLGGRSRGCNCARAARCSGDGGGDGDGRRGCYRGGGRAGCCRARGRPAGERGHHGGQHAAVQAGRWAGDTAQGAQ
jgi:hypothetical protein